MGFKVENNIVVVQETDSTNNYANHQLSESEVFEGTVFLAYNQKNGRGQLNNKWESEAGKNLTFSLVLKPLFLEIQNQFMISKVVTLGIYSALKSDVANLRIKWPNDIYAGDKKLGGILIENSIMSGRITNSIIGIGLNVNQDSFFSNAPNPVSLKQITQREFDLIPLLQKVISGINSFYEKLKDEQVALINELFHEKMYRFGGEYRYYSNNEMFTGKIIGVNEIGQLMILDEKERIRQFHFKEVEFVF